MQTDSDSIDNTDRQKTSAARETFDAVSFYGYDFIFYNNIFPFKIWWIIYFYLILYLHICMIYLLAYIHVHTYIHTYSYLQT